MQPGTTVNESNSARLVLALVAAWAVAVVLGTFSHALGAAIGAALAVSILTVGWRSIVAPWVTERDLLAEPASWGIAFLALSPFLPARIGPSIAGLSIDDTPLLVGTVLLAWSVMRDEGWPALRQPLALPLALFAVWNGVAVFLSDSVTVASLLRGVGRWGLFAVAFALLIVVAKRGRKWVMLMVGAMFVFGLLQAFFGLWSYAVDWILLDPNIARNIGMERFRWYQVLFDVVPGRITGTLGVSSNFYGALMLFPLLLSAAFLLKAKDWSERIAYGAVMAVTWFALVFSYTRASMAAAVIGFVFLIVLTRGYRLTGLAVLLVVAAVVFTPALDRFDEGNDRFNLAFNAFDVISDNPLGGLGPGQFSEELGEEGGRAIATPHNSYLLAAAETGLIGGGLLFLATVLPAAYVAIGAFRRRPVDLVLGALVAVMAAYGAQTLSNNLFHIPTVAIYFWIAAAAGIGLVAARTSPDDTEATSLALEEAA